MTIPIKVCDGREKAYDHRGKLKYFDLKYKDHMWTGNVSNHNYKKILKYCNMHGLKFEINNSFGKRGTNYRTTFFKYNTPPIGNFYFCAYCGRLISEKKITIDHIYPVYRVNKSQRLQKKLKRTGATSVNDWQNLVAACMSCNLRKGTQTGLWILKAKLGKHAGFWTFRWMLRVTLSCVIMGVGFVYFYKLFI